LNLKFLPESTEASCDAPTDSKVPLYGWSCP
jgi:hypothetical protein